MLLSEQENTELRGIFRNSCLLSVNKVTSPLKAEKDLAGSYNSEELWEC
jgi:hypothetical protein